MANGEFTAEDLATEEWRPVGGHPEYAVSNLGRIMRTVATKGGIAGRILRSSRNRGGYHTVRPDGVTVTVHRVVAEAFLGVRPGGCVIDHKDGTKANNRSSNLEYVSARENTARATALGLRDALSGDNSWARRRPDLVLRGAAHGRALVSEGDVRVIRSLASQGATQRAIANLFSIGKTTVAHIVNRDTWSHIE